jgi:hypothetical protein
MYSTIELAARWGMHPGTLRNWRTANKGPKFIRIGTTIRYRASDVARWEAKK